ncbi:MAG: hypothetical protein SCM11_04005, partial [Bacillota bacterium]|nr:hypothetical protein [Bacillota bacterium]
MQQHPKKTGRKRRLLPLPWVILLDLVLLAAGLMTFSLFHHVLVRDVQTTGLSLPRPTNTTVQRPITTATTDANDTTTSTTTTADNQSDSSNPTGSQSGSSETTLVPISETSADPNDWRVKFADQFTDGAVIQTESVYRSANIAISVDQVQSGDAVYYFADIYLSNIEQFQTAFATGVYGRSLRDEVLDMAIDNNALLAISGDYYGIRDQGIVIRNGELYRDVLFQDVLVMYF